MLLNLGVICNSVNMSSKVLGNLTMNKCKVLKTFHSESLTTSTVNMQHVR
jgi:hypothetical protein